jgi:hypothetical protein
MRFQLTAAVQVGAFHYRAGNFIADSTANALPGDKVVPALCTPPFPFAGMVALDASALAALAAVGIVTTIGQVLVPVTGAASVDP